MGYVADPDTGQSAAKKLLEICSGLEEDDDRQNADSVVNVSSEANIELFKNMIQEGDQMCEELKELLAPEIIEFKIRLAEQNEKLADNAARLADNAARLADNAAQLADKDEKLANKDAEIAMLKKSWRILALRCRKIIAGHFIEAVSSGGGHIQQGCYALLEVPFTGVFVE